MKKQNENNKCRLLALSISILCLTQLGAAPSSFDGDKPTTSYNSTYSQTFNNTAGWDNTKFYNQWSTVNASTFVAADINNGYLGFVWSAKRIIYSNKTYSAPYVFQTNIDYTRGSNRGGMVIRYVQNGALDNQLQENGAGGAFNRAGIAFYPKDANNFYIQFSGTEAGTSTLQTRIVVPRPAGVTSFLTGKNTLRVEDFGATIYAYINENPFVRIELGGLSNGIYTSGEVFDATLVSKATFSNMVVPTSGLISVAQRDAALSLYDVSVQSLKPTSFDGDKAATTYATTYTQNFDAWDNTKFYNQWSTLNADVFSATNIENGFLKFIWSTNRIVYSKTSYPSPYIFSAKIGYGSTSNRGGIVIRMGENVGADRAQETSAGDPGFNRAGIALYPSSTGNSMNIKFSGVIATSTPYKIINVPIPSGKPNMLTGSPTISVEDFGSKIYVYYDEVPIARIELEGIYAGNYTSGSVYNASLNLAGTFSGMVVPLVGRVFVAQRDAQVRLYNATIQQPTFDSDKPVSMFSNSYNQTFNAWDATSFNAQWDVLNSFGSDNIISNDYLKFAWEGSRVMRSKATYKTPYVFKSTIDNDGNPWGGLIVRAPANGLIDDLQLPATDVGVAFNRAGIDVYPTQTGNAMYIQVVGALNGYNTPVYKCAVPIPAGMQNVNSGGSGEIKIEDFGTSLFVYYKGDPLARINLTGLTGNFYTSGTICNSSNTPIGQFTGMEIPATGKVGIAVRLNNNFRLYDATIQQQLLALTSSKTASSLGLSINSNNVSVTVSGTGTLLTLDVPVSINNLTVAPGAKLTLNDTKTLTGTLTLQSNETATATFVDKNTNLNKTDISATVQQYLPAASTRTWWYLASAVIGADWSVFGTNKVGEYNESTRAYSNPFSGNTVLTAGRGYVVKMTAASAATYQFENKVLNTGDFNIALTRTLNGTSDNKRGFNLVGNPYASYLNWELAHKASTNLRSTIWYRTGSGANMDFETYNAAIGVSVPTTASGYVPPMQAFWVKVDADPVSPETVSNGTLSLTNEMRSHDESATGNPLKTRAINDRQLIRLAISNGLATDETVIATHPEATDHFDHCDSEKMSNEDVNRPEIYTIAGNKELVINGVNALLDQSQFALGFRPGKAGNYSIKLTEWNNLNDMELVLRDNIENCNWTLTPNTQYHFDADAANTQTRFALLLRVKGSSTNVKGSSSSLTVVAIQGRIWIQNSNLAVAHIKVFNTMGQLLFSAMSQNNTVCLPQTLGAGVYIVKVNDELRKISL